MATEITVRGSFSASRPPQRATVHAEVSYQGPSMEPVYERLVEDLGLVQQSVSALARGDGAPVTRWSSDRLRTWSHQPWSQDGEQLPLVYHAGVSLQVRFRDFAALSSWVGDHVTSIEGFEVDTISWSLTAKANAKMARRVRRQAVRDAIDRAQLYADAMGLGAVTAVAIADVGMLNAGAASGGPRDALFAAAPDGAPGGSRSDVELVPKPIRMSASVDARFVVHGPASRHRPRQPREKHLRPQPKVPRTLGRPRSSSATTTLAIAHGFAPIPKASSSTFNAVISPAMPDCITRAVGRSMVRRPRKT